jgi:Uma2 family endonuclease
MKAQVNVERTMTYDEYVTLEERSEEKHEFLRGEIVLMAGGTPEHAALASALTIALGNALRGKPCRVFSSDLRIRVRETELTTYPDLTVVCGRIELASDDRHAVTNPIVIVEVLSEASEAYDRGAKFAHYRHLESLREYVLVSQETRRIEVYRRNEYRRFELYEFASGQELELVSIDVRFDVDEIYENPLDSR